MDGGPRRSWRQARRSARRGSWEVRSLTSRAKARVNRCLLHCTCHSLYCLLALYQPLCQYLPHPCTCRLACTCRSHRVCLIALYLPYFFICHTLAFTCYFSASAKSFFVPAYCLHLPFPCTSRAKSRVNQVPPCVVPMILLYCRLAFNTAFLYLKRS